ncbi:hypothetical protein OAN39_03420 [Flavobacteriaceae bacterium]|nr:hypothetical protein [Flavobacteriaceae bacterium]
MFLITYFDLDLGIILFGSNYGSALSICLPRLTGTLFASSTLCFKTIERESLIFIYIDIIKK